MNRHAKRLICILALCAAAGTAFWGLYRWTHGTTYTMNLPQADALERISLKCGGEAAKSLDSEAEMQELLTLLHGEERTTREESIQDMPSRTDEMTQIDFHFREKGASVLFVFQRDGRYQIEQPYNGIYDISKGEYEEILAYAR